MSRNRPEPGMCVHCGAEGELTWDHLLPESWRGTSIRKRQWRIPACEGCNRNYGEIERQLRFPLCMPLEPDSPGAEGVVEKVWNSLDPTRANDDRDRRAREREREAVKALFIVGPDGASIGAVADSEMVHVMLEKFVKGMTWLQDRLFIDDRRYEIVSRLIAADEVPDVFRTAAARIAVLGDALAIRRVTASVGEVDLRVGFFEIVLWSTLYFVATCNLRPRFLETELQRLRRDAGRPPTGPGIV